MLGAPARMRRLLDAAVELVAEDETRPRRIATIVARAALGERAP